MGRTAEPSADINEELGNADGTEFAVNASMFGALWGVGFALGIGELDKIFSRFAVLL